MTGDWRARAACNGTDPEDWFPDGSLGYATAFDAFATCAACPVREDCLEDALEAEGSLPLNCRAGIYASTGPAERHRIYLARRAEARRTAA